MRHQWRAKQAAIALQVVGAVEELLLPSVSSGKQFAGKVHTAHRPD